jgi:RNA polymerase sigma factor (sigma-70 family)
MAIVNTRELLNQFAREGSESAFAEVVEHHIDLVYAIALRKLNGDTHLAQDVTQLVFSDLARKANSLPGNVILAAWLYRHTTFRACEVLRAEGRRRAREQTAVEMNLLHEGGDPAWTDLAPALDDAVAQLNARDRDAIVLRFFERHDLRSIGAALGTSEDAVQKRITRALEKLHQILVKSGATLSLASLTTLLGAQTIAAAPAGLAPVICASALAATAGASGLTLTLLNLMTMTKLKMGAVSAILIVAVVTPIVIQQQSIAKLRRDNRQLTEQASFRAQNETPAANASLPDDRYRELLRLRGEVALLRKDSQELARLRSQRNAVPADPATPPALTAESWADVGLQSPDAALQTFLWAARHDDAEFVRKLIRWKKDDSVPDFDGLEEIVASLIPATIHYAGKLESIRILSQEQIDAQSARMKVEFTPSAGKASKQQDLLFVKEESDWKPVFSVWSPEKGSIQGALAAPPSRATIQ